jgi:hypothetical protein
MDPVSEIEAHVRTLSLMICRSSEPVARSHGLPTSLELNEDFPH